MFTCNYLKNYYEGTFGPMGLLVDKPLQNSATYVKPIA